MQHVQLQNSEENKWTKKNPIHEKVKRRKKQEAWENRKNRKEEDGRINI